ncbi:MAG: Rne/Rng family ribonuclease, partial [Myxococcota bacterium]|nr:Rne/Rng family ribonuclease [Myxococcota bacterium]
MTRKMLINGQRAEELRVAIISDHNILEQYEVEVAEAGLNRGNIYRGVVVNVQPSLNAAFIEYGEEKHGFLSINDVVEQSYHRKPKDANHPNIAEVLQRNHRILVQVIKDAAGSKGAQLTTNISLAGRYLVLRPFDPRGGISRKIDDESARADLHEQVKDLGLPAGFGCIIRTNAVDQARPVLVRDAKALLRLWERIVEQSQASNDPGLLYDDQDLIVQILRDHFDSTVAEVLIDDERCFERAMTYVRAAMPASADKLSRYEDRMPLFSRFNLEPQIEGIHARTVKLPSGGAIVIDPTEALTAIDVNSAKSTRRENQDETAYHTNLEAAVEVARQLRLRDIGGLTVVDFIDMRSGKHQRDIERVLRDAMKLDKARSKIGRISPNGLLEINRQRIKQAMQTRFFRDCPTCRGTGVVPSIDAVGLRLLRRIESRAAAGPVGKVRITLHPEIAQAVQNQRRHELAELESRLQLHVEVLSSPTTSRNEEHIEWLSESNGNGQGIKPSPKKVAALQYSDAVTAQDSSLEEATETPVEESRPSSRRRSRRDATTEPRTQAAVSPAAEERPREERREARSARQAPRSDEARSVQAPVAPPAESHEELLEAEQSPSASSSRRESPWQARRRRRLEKAAAEASPAGQVGQDATAQKQPAAPEVTGRAVSASRSVEQELGGAGQAPNQQELGGAGQAPNQQELGGAGQAPNQQENGEASSAPQASASESGEKASKEPPWLARRRRRQQAEAPAAESTTAAAVLEEPKLADSTVAVVDKPAVVSKTQRELPLPELTAEQPNAEEPSPRQRLENFKRRRLERGRSEGRAEERTEDRSEERTEEPARRERSERRERPERAERTEEPERRERSERRERPERPEQTEEPERRERSERRERPERAERTEEPARRERSERRERPERAERTEEPERRERSERRERPERPERTEEPERRERSERRERPERPERTDEPERRERSERRERPERPERTEEPERRER